MSSRIAVVLIACSFVSIAVVARSARGQQQPPPAGPVDLLARVDPAQGAVVGVWSKLGQQLRVVAGARARCVLPYDVRGGYDLGVEFTRTRGEDSVGIIIPVGTGQCIVNFSAFTGESHGIALINGKQARDNETTVRPGKLTNNNRYRVDVSVRLDGAWQYLRTNFPGKYEAGADMEKNEWFHARFEIKGAELRIFVNADPKPVLVVEKMLDGISRGTVGVWGWNTYFANFKYTPASD